MYDEEAERKAFMEAVGEWRKEGPVKKLTIVREYLPPGQQEQVITKYSGSEQDNSYGSDDGMWKNPFAVPVGSDRSQLMDDSDDEATTKKQVKVEIIRDADSKGQHLGDGILDEDKEHEVNMTSEESITFSIFYIDILRLV